MNVPCIVFFTALGNLLTRFSPCSISVFFADAFGFALVVLLCAAPLSCSCWSSSAAVCWVEDSCSTATPGADTPLLADLEVLHSDSSEAEASS